MQWCPEDRVGSHPTRWFDGWMRVKQHSFMWRASGETYVEPIRVEILRLSSQQSVESSLKNLTILSNQLSYVTVAGSFQIMKVKLNLLWKMSNVPLPSTLGV